MVYEMVGSKGYIRTLIHVPSSVLRDNSRQSSIGYLSSSDSSALKSTTKYTYLVGLVSLLRYLIDLTCYGAWLGRYTKQRILCYGALLGRYTTRRITT